MKQSTYWSIAIFSLILLVLIVSVDSFKVIATPHDAIWWNFTLIAFMNLHGIEGSKEFVSLGKKFSKPFKDTYKYVFLIWATATWASGLAERTALIFDQSVAQGIGFSIGIVIGAYLFPLLFTYLIRLLLPFFKIVHDKANK